jgi:tetrapyrrole methylase family protein/MazG family protein
MTEQITAATAGALGRVTVVGLGPGDDRYLTASALDAIDRAQHRYLRTAVHPSAAVVRDPITFDHHYRTAPDFDAVYRAIHADLRAAAIEYGEILYAVPGSPLVLERTVRSLRMDPDLEVVILPALSFLDLAYDRLGIDPIETGLSLIDGHRFALAAAAVSGPMLVAHTHAEWVISQIKLAVDDPADQFGDPPVIGLQRLGTDDEMIVETTWSQMDRTIDADHLTTLYIPALRHPVAAEYQRFHQLARTLREQCPWDIEQTHQSLIPHLVEETYEVIDAIEALDPDDPLSDHDLIEELGDLLYQVEFHATIAEQQGRFTIADVARGIHDKLVRRHPHVFGGDGAESPRPVLDTAGVEDQWESIKRTEKSRRSIFDGVPTALPALGYARKVQSKAARVGFDWPDVGGALAKIAEESVELLNATGDAERSDELGDLLFAVVNVARHLDIDPEMALRRAVSKFRSRFDAVERLATDRGIELATSDLATIDSLWDEVKATETGR